MSQGPWTQGDFSPVKTAALKRKAGAQRAREPVTKATAVKPNVDNTKLGLQEYKQIGSIKQDMCTRSAISHHKDTLNTQ